MELQFSKLANDFASCSEPERLQQLCDARDPQHLQSFFERWLHAIPTHSAPRIVWPAIGGNSPALDRDLHNDCL